MRPQTSLAQLLLAVGGSALLLVLGFFLIPSKTLDTVVKVSPNSSISPHLVSIAKPDVVASAIILPHHDVVKKQREALLAEFVAKFPQPKTIILISPNHYDVGRANIQTNDQVWDITNGTIKPETSVIAELAKNGVGLESSSFNNEHGIKLILDDQKTTFPDATIVPIIIKSTTTKDEVSKIEQTLNTSCHDCLVIASVDFSHYQPALLGDLHDDVSIRSLENLDTDSLMTKAEVDSPAALTFTALWAKDHNTSQFHLQNHTNSGELVNNPDLEATSHVLGWYQTGTQTVPDNSVSFLIGGDMMFGRMIAHTFLSQGLSTALDELGNRVFWGTDAGIVNLEGPVSATPVPDNIEPNNLTFNFPPQAIQALSFLKVNAASQANNHSGNAGAKGLQTTRDLLTQAKIQPFGGPGSSDVDKMASFSGQGLTLKVIGVHTLEEIPDITPLIKQLKTDPKNRVLIFPHWGTEYRDTHTTTQAQQAHTWIDAGADIVIGAHPHVVEDSELYKGKPIIYSMGNLLFDQTFSPQTQEGLFVAGKFTDKGLQLFILPDESVKLKPRLAPQPLKDQILQKLYAPFTQQLQTTQAGKLLFFPN